MPNVTNTHLSVVVVPFQTWMAAVRKALTAPNHQLHLGNYGRGTGLQAQPSVVSVAALQPLRRQKLWHAIADDRRGDAVASYGFKEVPPGHQSLDADLWGRSRATCRALGCVRSGFTAFAMATKVREIVSKVETK